MISSSCPEIRLPCWLRFGLHQPLGLPVALCWFGVAAPKDTPAEVVDILNREINASFADPRIGARLADMSGMALAGLPAVFGRLIADETEKWGRVIRAANIKAE